MLEKGPYAGNTLGAQQKSPIKALGAPFVVLWVLLLWRVNYDGFIGR